MAYWQGVVLGIVQGLTEFLPISSSGHLVIAEAVLGLSTPGVTVEVALHVATLLAVVIVYRARLGELVLGAVRFKHDAWRYVVLIVVGSIPAGVIGLAFAHFFERTFESLLVVGLNLILTGVFLWSAKWALTAASSDRPTTGGAVAIGFAQALAILPGISRSGATVTVALWLKVDPVKAAEFSFILAIPAIAGAALLQIPDLSGDVASVGAGPLLVSFIAALVSGVVAIRVLVELLRRRVFHQFAPYCWTIGLVTIVWTLVG